MYSKCSSIYVQSDKKTILTLHEQRYCLILHLHICTGKDIVWNEV